MQSIKISDQNMACLFMKTGVSGRIDKLIEGIMKSQNQKTWLLFIQVSAYSLLFHSFTISFRNRRAKSFFGTPGLSLPINGKEFHRLYPRILQEWARRRRK